MRDRRRKSRDKAKKKKAKLLGAATALLCVGGGLRAAGMLRIDADDDGIRQEQPRELWREQEIVLGKEDLNVPARFDAALHRVAAEDLGLVDGLNASRADPARGSCVNPALVRLRAEEDLFRPEIAGPVDEVSLFALRNNGQDDERERDEASRWFQPQLARFLCKDEEVRNWHARYGDVAEYNRLCAVPWTQSSLRSWTHVMERPAFSLARARRLGWPLLRFGGGVVVQHEGGVLLRAGVGVQGADCCYCETALKVRDTAKACACLGGEAGAQGCALARYSRVFSLAQVFGYGYAHFVKEVLPRLAPFAALLRADPDVQIHVKTLHDGAPASFVHGFVALLGIDPRRLVTGDIFAHEAWVPLWTACGMASAQYQGLLAARNLAWRATAHGVQETRPLVIILERRVGTRRWDEAPWRYEAVAEAVRKGVPAAGPHRIARVRDDDDRLLGCVACQVRLFRRADAVVGVHGAGLSNALFMRPGGLVVELGWPGQQTEYAVLAHVSGHKYVLYDARDVAADAWTRLTRVVDAHIRAL